MSTKSDPGPFGWVSFDDIMDPFPQEEESWTIDEMAFITISLDKSKANRRKARAQARRQFIAMADTKPRYIKKISVIEEKEVVLFTSIQVEYKIQIIADPGAVTEFYFNKEKI